MIRIPTGAMAPLPSVTIRTSIGIRAGRKPVATPPCPSFAPIYRYPPWHGGAAHPIPRPAQTVSHGWLFYPLIAQAGEGPIAAPGVAPGGLFYSALKSGVAGCRIPIRAVADAQRWNFFRIRGPGYAAART